MRKRERVRERESARLSKREREEKQNHFLAKNEYFGAAAANEKISLSSKIVNVTGAGVASDTRGPGFESSHRQLLLNNYSLLSVCRKDKNKEKEAGKCQLIF